MSRPPGSVDQLFAPFREQPREAGLFTDFDGTLSAIVTDPAAARPVPGAMAALERLAGRLAAVWIVSGRDVAFLEPFVPGAVHISGLYGLESSVDGRRQRAPGRGPLARRRSRTRPGAAEADAGDRPGALRAPGGTQRARRHPALPRPGRAGRRGPGLRREQAAASGLVLHPARRSYELRPPIAVDKGSVVSAEAAGLQAVCFIGDDQGDLAAFDALDRLAAEGGHVVRVAVASGEAPAELLERADRVVDGPAAVVSLLESW